MQLGHHAKADGRWRIYAFADRPAVVDIFERYGIDRGGVVVVVRPDQHIANVLPLAAHAELAEFLEPIFSTSIESRLESAVTRH